MRDLLEPLVRGRARVDEHRDLEAELAPVNRRLHDAAFGRSPGEQDPLDLEIAEDQLERSVVERGVAGLDDEAVACLRRDRGDEFRAECGRKDARSC